MRKHHSGLPPGFRDLLFEETAERRTMDHSLAELYASRGYREVQPSGIEFLDVYTRGHQIISERAYKFLDREDRLLALRADFTPSVARLVSSRYPEGAEPLRIWYSGNVFRRVDHRKGGYAEFWQVGAECIGGSDVGFDVEMISLALESLAAIGVGDAVVHLNHAGIFRGILNSLRLSPQARERLKSAIDHKDARALATHLDDLDVSSAIGEQVRFLTRSIGDTSILREAARTLTDEESRSALDHLGKVASGLERWQGRLVFDLTEIDEMEYYTGVMFTLLSPSHRAPLGTGGRYDTLLRSFGTDRPAIGYSLAMDVLLRGT
jgi:ATP phosphoribosyltransferase regulatory subunit